MESIRLMAAIWKGPFLQPLLVEFIPRSTRWELHLAHLKGKNMMATKNKLEDTVYI